MSADVPVILKDAIAAEFLKLRTVRATYLVLAGALCAVALGSLVVLVVSGSYDVASEADKSSFEPADPTVVVMPFVAFFVGCLGGLAVTTEYGTRSVIGSLIAVPRRGVLVAAKAIVVTAVTLVVGVALAFLSFFVANAILGDRPRPFNPWTSVGDAIPSVVATGVAVVVAALIAMGLGLLLRSTSATLVTLGAVLLVIPIFAHFLPSPLGERVASFMPSNLPPQLTGTNDTYVLSPAGAALVMTSYIVLSLTAGVIGFKRRDA
ncbi:ABC transporter permease [Amycolatopsis alba]|uniref:ABC transporter permease n=1 Tax=Amycolatopsis alba DSM 44262 TaxID=1125972 RepID=A0A229RVW2_AMYAL|nr:ABC transporter permease [Amycolatopsis alba]OXM50494.1 ABC transporter permease [Amycolatopsis alba DSM 44262]